MENKINIAELLKDCPKGMELDCTLFEGLEFDGIVDNEYLPIRCRVKNPNGGYNVYNFTKYGCWIDTTFAKCVIFPKGETTWEGFVPPIQFKDGDIVATQNGIWIGIHKRMVGNAHEVYFAINHDCLIYNDNIFCFERLATEEEKQKLFDAIKANGYKWNEDTKKLVPNKFDITTLKPFDKVLVRDHNAQEWVASLFSNYNEPKKYKYICVNGSGYAQCIPYEGNEHLLDTSNDCDEYYKTWE